MRGVRLVVPWCLPVVVGLGLLLSGCADESKKSGTSVQETPAQKAQTDEMRDMYKNTKIQR